MSEPAIAIRDLGKRYRIGVREEGRKNLLQRIGGLATAPIRRFRKLGENGDDSDVLWALRDVSFDVMPGEVIGIIGRNGAGKSTLLKILSQITEPSEGEARIRGRVGSLLEVGTGFHPELTGRENVYLNGSILGMTKVEIDGKFDEIAAFAEINKFLDTPVKRYSSGMRVRLGFAVAAHLEPEILIVDEVLAVGDAEFQRKCLGKMSDAAGEGRTVLFVSHQLAAVRTLCSKGVYLDGGTVKMIGDVDDVISHYLSSGARQEGASLAERTDRVGSGDMKFTDIQFRNAAGHVVQTITSGDEITMEISYSARVRIDTQRLYMSFSFWDRFGNMVMLYATDEMRPAFKPFGESGVIKLHIPEFLLRAGDYNVRLQASYPDPTLKNAYDCVENAAQLQVLPGDYWRIGAQNRPGLFALVPGTITNE